jgi:hypothetical protein
VKYFKITKTWAVKVEDDATEADAIKLVAADPEKYLDAEIVSRTEYKRSQQKASGWGTAIRDQLIGSGSNGQTAR